MSGASLGEEASSSSSLINVVKKRKFNNLEIEENFFECPACQDIPIDKVYQCSEGHIICSICYALMQQKLCCICRREMDVPYRNRLAEDLIRKLPRSCKHEGCGFVSTVGEIWKHEEKCNYGPVFCPLTYCNCVLNGKKNREGKNIRQSSILMNHLMDKNGPHRARGSKFFDDESLGKIGFSEVRFNVKKIYGGMEEMITGVIQLHQENFVYFILFGRNEIEFSLLCIGPENYEDGKDYSYSDYSYQVKVMDDNGTTISYSLFKSRYTREKNFRTLNQDGESFIMSINRAINLGTNLPSSPEKFYLRALISVYKTPIDSEKNKQKML